jgi:hypothetical protein
MSVHSKPQRKKYHDSVHVSEESSSVHDEEIVKKAAEEVKLWRNQKNSIYYEAMAKLINAEKYISKEKAREIERKVNDDLNIRPYN